MRFCFTLFLSILIPFTSFGQDKRVGAVGTYFEPISLHEAIERASKAGKREPKMIFVDCFTTWCGPCKKMSSSVFPQKEVGEYLNSNFLVIKIDMEKEEGIEVLKRYNIKAYPTFLLLDAKGDEINRVVGSSEAEQFIKKIKKALDPSSTLEALRANYIQEKNFTNALAYLTTAIEAYKYPEIKAFMEEIFPQLPIWERYSESIWPYLSYTLKDPNSVVFDILLLEKIEADRTLTKERVDKAIRDGLISFATSFVSGNLGELDREEIIGKLNYLPYVAENRAEVPLVLDVARKYYEGKIEEIERYFEMNLEWLGVYERGILEKMLFSIEGISNEKKIGFFKLKLEHYNRESEKANRELEKLIENR